jgi:hypothetical protein
MSRSALEIDRIRAQINILFGARRERDSGFLPHRDRQ